MRPDTKYRIEVARLFPQLPSLTDRQRQYALTHRPDRQALYNRGQVWCPDCGAIIPRQISHGHIADLHERFTCPCCGTRSTLVYSRKTRFDQKAYFSIITMHAGWQVVRHYLCSWHFRRDGRQPAFYIAEVVQSWITPDGRHEVFVARPRNALCGGVLDSFRTHMPMAIRYNHGAYHIWGEIIYPHATVYPLARRNGFSVPAACEALAPTELIRCLLQTERYPGLEMLVKIRQYSLANALFAGYRSFDTYATQIRICHRHGYTVSDGRLWCDYIDMLRRQCLDTHNPHYICPRNLKKAHDQLAERINRAERRRRLADQLRQARRDEEAYRRDKAPYLDIAFGDDTVHIAVLQSVEEIAREGQAMHHCVFAAKYYRRRDSLLLSARDRDGNRLETIEVDLQTFTVAQSRALCNGTSPHHDHILRLMARNMHLIRQVARKAQSPSTPTKQPSPEQIPA